MKKNDTEKVKNLLNLSKYAEIQIVEVEGKAENEVEFQSCSESPLGAACEFIYPFPDGVTESVIPFTVIFYERDELGEIVPAPPSDPSTLTADGSPPTFTSLNAEQKGSNITVEFTVEDKGVGIKMIEILDADTNAVLQSFSEFEVADKTFTFSGFLETTSKISSDHFASYCFTWAAGSSPLSSRYLSNRILPFQSSAQAEPLQAFLAPT